MENINLDINNLVDIEEKKKKTPTVLIVEDEEAERLSLKAALETENIIVEVAADGAEAENKIKKQFFDIMIVDYRLPDIDGLNLIKKIKSTLPDLMPIVVTAYSSIEIAIDSMKIGAYDYLVKPLDVSNLVKTIYKIVEDTEILFESKKNLTEMVTRNTMNYTTDTKNIIVVTTPDTSVLVDSGRKFNILFYISRFFRLIKNYYWG